MLKCKPEEAFLVESGEKISTIEELLDYLKNNPHDYVKHVNDNKNDFAEWILHCLHEKKLAESLRNTFNLEDCINTIESFLQDKHSRENERIPEEVEEKHDFKTVQQENRSEENTPKELLKETSKEKLKEESKEKIVGNTVEEKNSEEKEVNENKTKSDYSKNDYSKEIDEKVRKASEKLDSNIEPIKKHKNWFSRLNEKIKNEGLFILVGIVIGLIIGKILF